MNTNYNSTRVKRFMVQGSRFRNELYLYIFTTLNGEPGTDRFT